jgi:hypothetical protein
MKLNLNFQRVYLYYNKTQYVPRIITTLIDTETIEVAVELHLVSMLDQYSTGSR